MTSTTNVIKPPPYLYWLAALAGALIIAVLSMITTRDDASAPLTSTDMELTLGGIQTIKQVFTITRPDLVGVAIPLMPAAQGGADLRIAVHIRYADGSPDDLVSENLPVQSAEAGVLTIRFAPTSIVSDPRMPTTTLKLILDIPTLPPGTGPTIRVRANSLAQGALTIDEHTESGRDLVITPIYQRRWVDSVWPISAMARGKPGLLGWPPFYALLAYVYLLALSVGVASLRRAMLA
jgi:hypothetical protein